MTAAPADTDAVNRSREAARFMNGYARRFSAGAFATPIATEVQRMMSAGRWQEWGRGSRACAATRTLNRDTYRTDYTGRRFTLPAGSRIITHLAADVDAELPNLDGYAAVFAYVEDHNVTRQLRAQGREVRGVRVSAASELIACWGRAGEGYPYSPADRATLVALPTDVPEETQKQVLREVAAVDQWHDDYPYYSDGSWGAVSLRGFNPADPTWGVKPAEMSKAWWAAHPESHRFNRCDWTVLAERMPATVEMIQRTWWWRGLERVRLLRMAGRDGKGGTLTRHTDVTDRAAGTANGKIVRFHIPLVTHPQVTMSAWNLWGERTDVHLPPWSMWYLDARKPHAVANRSGIDRIHLVVDVIADPECRERIAGGQDMAA